MATIDLTNIVTNGSFETNTNGWVGYMTNQQGTQSTLAPLRVVNNTPLPVHGETGAWCAQMGTKTQGLVYINPTTPIPTIIGHKYYVRARVSLRGNTVPGVTTGCTVIHGTTIPVRGTALPPPLFDGLQTPNIEDWNLIDCIWTADIAGLNMRFIWQQTGNMGNNETYGRVDNIVMVDLTEAFGAGNEPPLFAIRQGVRNVPPNGWWDGTTTITMPIPPVITTDALPIAIKGRGYSTQIELEENTGTAPFVYTISGLPLNSGLFMNMSGELYGTSNLNEGSYVVEVMVSDSIGYITTKEYILDAGEPPFIVDDYIPGASLNEPYSFTPTVIGSDGNLAVYVAVTSGTMPTGLSISGTTISGTPTVDNQSCQITVTAYNDYAPEGVSRTYTLNVSYAARINTVSPLPDGVVDLPYSFAFNGYGEFPYVWEVLGGGLPPGLYLDTDGVLSGTPTTAGTYSFSVQASNAHGADTRLYTLTVYQRPVITTTTLGYARLGTAYSSTLTAIGTMPITWFITDGRLPTGLFLDQFSGIISGAAVTAGSFTFTVVATNVAGVSVPVTLTIEAGSALAITSLSPLPNGILNTAYTPFTFHAEGLDDSYVYTWSWTAQAGSSFPPGLTLNANTGVLSGTPTAIGTYNVNVTITGGGTSTTAPFTITVGTPPVITSDTNLGGGISRPYSIVLQAIGTLPITWTMTVGPSPAVDVRLSPAGVLSWMIPEIGTYTFTVVASNVFGDSVPVEFSLTITTPSIIDVDLDDGIVGIPYSHTFTAAGATPYTWSQPSGELPPGLSLDGAMGTLSGNPTTSGTYHFSIRVDNIGGYAEEAFVLTIYERPLITTLVLNSGNDGVYYSQTLLASGTTPITWSVLDPIDDETGLPPGTVLNGAIISGVLATQGVFKFTVKAENITGPDYADTRQFTISVGPYGAPVILTGSPINVRRGWPYQYALILSATGNEPITWSLAGGSSLPDGFSLVDGMIVGNPVDAGVFTFTIIAENDVGSDSRTFTMIVADPPIITTTVLPNGTTRTAYSETLFATGDTPISWQVMDVTGSETGLPPGLVLNTSTGEIYGTPITDGIYVFSIRATNTVDYDTVQFSITIVSVGGTFINGKEIGDLFIAGKEVSHAFVGGVRIY